jgi:flagellar motor switch protein FliM
MKGTLSQPEIDALLVAAGRPGVDAGARQIGPPVVRAARYNFRRPDRVSKEHLRSLHFLHDRFAVNLSSSLSAFLRAVTEVSIVSVEQFSYAEFLTSLPDPTAFYSFAMPPSEGMSALEINPSVAFTMVDRMLGGTGQTPPPNRALTEIEQNVLDSVVKLLLEHLTETWRAIAEMQFRIQDRETRPQMLRVTGPNEIVILLAFELRIAEMRGMVNLCFPAAMIEALEDKFAQGWQRTRRQPTAVEQLRLTANLGRVPLPVTTLLETRLPARELLSLKVGDIVSLGHPASGPVDVHVGKVRRFLGRLTTSPAGAAVRVDRVSLEYNESGGAQ